MKQQTIRFLYKGILLISCTMVWLFGCTTSSGVSSATLLSYRQNPFSCDITVSTGSLEPQTYHMIHGQEDSFALRLPAYDESFKITTDGTEATLTLGDLQMPLELNDTRGIGLIRRLMIGDPPENDIRVDVKEENGCSYYMLRDQTAEFLFDMDTGNPERITYNGEQETTVILVENLSFLP